MEMQSESLQKVICIICACDLTQITPQYDAFHNLIWGTSQHDLSHFMAPFDANCTTSEITLLHNLAKIS